LIVRKLCTVDDSPKVRALAKLIIALSGPCDGKGLFNL